MGCAPYAREAYHEIPLVWVLETENQCHPRRGAGELAAALGSSPNSEGGPGRADEGLSPSPLCPPL